MQKLILALAVCCAARATVTQVNCSSSATVASALSAAVSGDTIQCASAGTYSWSTVTLPATKDITLDGNGATLSAGQIGLPSSATFRARVTGFHFTMTNAIGTDDGIDNLPWRLDHCTFTGSGTLITFGNGPGLFDHNSLTGLDVAQEAIHIWGWGDGVTTGWTNAHTPGSYKAIYMEDNSWSGAQGNSTSAFQGYYGERVVARYNTTSGAMFEEHGTPGQIGARWWEFYKNTFTGSSIICLRAGSGIVFGNTGPTSIKMLEEDSGYPALYQIGRGQSQALTPAYVWSNGTDPSLNTSGCAAPAANMVQLNRDVYQDTSASCTAGGSCTTGLGSGTTLPTSCTAGTGFWKTDEGGNWDSTHGGANDGLLYKCTATNTWTAYYTPLTYPYPLTAGGLADPAGASPSAPTVTTTTASSITASGASSGGNVTADGGASVTARGVCYATSATPTTPCTSDGTGAGTFTSTLSGLSASTLYHYRAFATNSVGTSYGSDLTFTTDAAPPSGTNRSGPRVTVGPKTRKGE